MKTTFMTPIQTSNSQLVYGKACHYLVNLEHKALSEMKLLHMNASLGALERTYERLELEVYMFHAYESA